MVPLLCFFGSSASGQALAALTRPELQSSPAGGSRARTWPAFVPRAFGYSSGGMSPNAVNLSAARWGAPHSCSGHGLLPTRTVAAGPLVCAERWLLMSQIVLGASLLRCPAATPFAVRGTRGCFPLSMVAAMEWPLLKGLLATAREALRPWLDATCRRLWHLAQCLAENLPLQAFMTSEPQPSLISRFSAASFHACFVAASPHVLLEQATQGALALIRARPRGSSQSALLACPSWALDFCGPADVLFHF